MKKFVLSCLVLFVFLTVAASAEDTYIKIEDFSNDTVAFSINSATAYDEAIVLVSGYAESGQFVGSVTQTASIPVGTYFSSANLPKNAAEFQVMLLDSETYAPLCECGKICSVVFTDKDGNILAEQKVYSGNAALPPEAPAVANSIFVNWDADFTHIIGDTVISPVYTEENAENLFTVSSCSVDLDEEVKVRISLGGTVNLSAYDMRLQYDADVLEFVSLDTEFSMDVVANHVASGGYIRFNYSSRTNRTRAGDILEVTFRIKEGVPAQGTAVRLSPIQVVFVDTASGNIPAPCAFTVTEGVIRIS